MRATFAPYREEPRRLGSWNGKAARSRAYSSDRQTRCCVSLILRDVHCMNNVSIHLAPEPHQSSSAFCYGIQASACAPQGALLPSKPTPSMLCKTRDVTSTTLTLSTVQFISIVSHERLRGSTGVVAACSRRSRKKSATSERNTKALSMDGVFTMLTPHMMPRREFGFDDKAQEVARGRSVYVVLRSSAPPVKSHHVGSV